MPRPSNSSVSSLNGLDVKLQSGGRSGILVVVFSQARIPPGKFGLERLFANTQHSCVFLNDLHAQWYLNTQEEIDRAIDHAVVRENPKRIIYYGASMGAYGALITGLRRKDGEIFAFSPELELGLPGGQSLAYVKPPFPAKQSLLSALSSLSNHSVNLFFGLFDPIDTAGYLEIQQLPAYKHLHCFGLAGPHALHDQLYSLNIIRQLIKTFTRDITEILTSRCLHYSLDQDACRQFVQLSTALETKQNIEAIPAYEILQDNPGYGLLAARRLAHLGNPLDGATLLLDWHARIVGNAVMKTTPKRWRKQFLIRATELLSSGSHNAKARDVLGYCTDLYPIDDHVRQLAKRLELDLLTPNR